MRKLPAELQRDVDPGFPVPRLNRRESRAIGLVFRLSELERGDRLFIQAIHLCHAGIGRGPGIAELPDPLFEPLQALAVRSGQGAP